MFFKKKTFRYVLHSVCLHPLSHKNFTLFTLKHTPHIQTHDFFFMLIEINEYRMHHQSMNIHIVIFNCSVKVKHANSIMQSSHKFQHIFSIHSHNFSNKLQRKKICIKFIDVYVYYSSCDAYCTHTQWCTILIFIAGCRLEILDFKLNNLIHLKTLKICLFFYSFVTRQNN